MAYFSPNKKSTSLISVIYTIEINSGKKMLLASVWKRTEDEGIVEEMV